MKIKLKNLIVMHFWILGGCDHKITKIEVEENVEFYVRRYPEYKVTKKEIEEIKTELTNHFVKNCIAQPVI